jgi:hypothetical protein
VSTNLSDDDTGRNALSTSADVSAACVAGLAGHQSRVQTGDTVPSMETVEGNSRFSGC